jgi:predicted Zn-dependent protease
MKFNNHSASVLLPIIILISFTLLTSPNLDQQQIIASSSHNGGRGGHTITNNHSMSPVDSILICCSWGAKIANGVLTYKIIGGSASDQQSVRNAIGEWNTNIKGLQFAEISNGSMADVDVYFNHRAINIHGGAHTTNGGGRNIRVAIPGETMSNFDNSGFITHVAITISKSAFGNSLGSNKLQQISMHELGHALGLGHANFNGDLMSPVLNTEAKVISKCDVSGVLQANQWKFESNNSPQPPHLDHVNC